MALVGEPLERYCGVLPSGRQPSEIASRRAPARPRVEDTEQVREAVRDTRWASPSFHPPHVGAGTGANLIHHVAPLVGRGPLGRAKVHAARFVERVRRWANEDVPHAAAVVREVAPFMPALLRRLALEARDLAPEPDALYRKVLSSIVAPNEGEQQAIASAAEAPAAVPPGASTHLYVVP